jgi:transglutaminase-like putative cysteine protease
MRLTFYIAATLSFGTAMLGHAQSEYDVAKISPEMMKGSTVVVRNEELNLVVKNAATASMTYKTAVTILTKNGEDHASMSEYYDKFSSLSNLKATMYDAKGLKIKTYKGSDFKDRSLTSDGTMYDDNRLKSLEFLNSNYPFTIEYSYQKDYYGYLNFPSWYPIVSYDLSVEKAAYTLQMPRDLTFRYLKSKGLKTDSTIIDKNVVYKWTAQNLPSIEYEPMSVGLKEITPWVQASPNRFEYDNTKGNVESWADLGTWLYGLSSNITSLPESTLTMIRGLVAGAKSDKEKIAILYNYLQSNTRYVSIQLGIGGFKPMAADRVAAVNYGDCKALSNYMKALLAAVDIKSNLVMLGSDMPSLNPRYSSFGQANHMVLCVPSAKDTTWLECTSQYMPAGFLGNSTAGKTVLLVTENGGKLVQTPQYRPADNYQDRKATVNLTAAGSADILIKTNFGSCQYENNLGMMLKDPTAQRKSLLNSLGVPNMELISAAYTQPDKGRPVIEERVELKSTEMFSNGGDKLFLTLNLLNRNKSVPRKVDNRRTSFQVSFGFRDTDEVIYTIPAGYKAEFIPAPVVIESEFGRYTASVVLKDNTIVYTRVQQMNSKEYPPQKYVDAVAFYKQMYLADRQKAILVKVN